MSEMTASIKREIENLQEHKDFLSGLLDKEIVDIQVQRNRTQHTWEVVYFWPTFLWFRGRGRMDYEVFKLLIEE